MKLTQTQEGIAWFLIGGLIVLIVYLAMPVQAPEPVEQPDSVRVYILENAEGERFEVSDE